MPSAMTLTPELARLAASSLCDVFTPEGDAVTIASLRGDRATVTGERHHGERFAISELTASRALLSLARKAAREITVDVPDEAPTLTPAAAGALLAILRKAAHE